MTTVFNLNRYDKIVANDLSLNGTISSALGGFSKWSSSGSDIYFSGGNVGIGTSSPDQLLQVKGANSDYPAMRLSNDNANFDIMMTGSSFNNVLFTNRANGNILFETTGNVGIGTATPEQKLHVAGHILLRETSTYYGKISGNNDNHSIWLRYSYDGTYNMSFYEFNDIRFFTGGQIQDQTEKMRITSTGNVGIGTTNPPNKLALKVTTTYDGFVLINQSDNTIGKMGRDAYGGGYLNLYDNNGSGKVSINSTGNTFFNSGGNVGIGTTSPGGPLQVKSNFIVDDYGQPHVMSQHAAVFEKGSSLDGQRWWMKYNGNNNLAFHYGGGGVFYMQNGGGGSIHTTFTGQHRSCIENIPSKDINNYTGLIVSADKNDYINIDHNLVRGKDAITINNSIPYVSLTSIEKDRKVFGVISGSEDPEKREFEAGIVSVLRKQTGDTRAFINSIGEGAIWVSNKNGNLQSGEYITSSSITGYGQKQDSEFLANYTVGKITMDCDFAPPLQYKKQIKQELIEYTVDASGNYLNNQNNDMLYGYKLVNPEDVSNNQYESVKTKHPDYNITLDLSNNFIKATKNILDEHGDIQWEDTTEQETKYDIRYLDASGNILTKDQYDTMISGGQNAYIAAFVGCTYHCG